MQPTLGAIVLAGNHNPDIKKQGLSLVKRIFIYFTLTSLTVAGLISAGFLAWNNHQESTRFEKDVDHLRSTYGLALAHSLWQYDEAQVGFILDGILSHSNITYVRANDNTSLSIERGVRPYHSKVVQIPLFNNKQEVGELHLSFDYSNSLWASFNTALPYMLGTLFLFLLVAAIFTLIVHQTIMARILALLKETRYRLRQGTYKPLGRSKSKHNDEIDDLITAVNELNELLLGELIQNSKSQKQLSVINAELEERVQERTQHLSEIIKQLNLTLDDLHSTQGQLINAEKLSALGGMIAAIGHEIETPLGLCLTIESCLRNDIKALRESMTSNNTNNVPEALNAVEESLMMLNKNLHRASDLMRSFKEVSAGHIDEDNEWINLSETLNAVLHTLHPKLRDSNHQIKIDCSEHITIQASSTAISQIFTNLIMNSITHAFREMDKGYITIKVGEDRENIVIRYSDNGVGLSEEAKKKIFEPLFTTLRGKGGTGLGMHLVYNIIRQRMKGDIQLEDPTEGVAFRISMPKHKSQRRAKARKAVY